VRKGGMRSAGRTRRVVAIFVVEVCEVD
jgi:hypothetical protein